MAKLFVVGLGPGAESGLTGEACAALYSVERICGYGVYLSLIKPLFPGKEWYETPMKQELARCRHALKEAQKGRDVALVCSGDAGVYGMAAPTLELLPEYPGGEVQIVAKENATEADFAGTNVMKIAAVPTQTKAIFYTGKAAYLLTHTELPQKTKYKYISHKALATDLAPGTAYSWRVGYEGHWSEIAQFRTEDAQQGEYTFLYMTDSHIMNPEYIRAARRCALAAVKTVPEARFCVFPGDFVEDGDSNNSEWEWEQWFEESMKPVILAMPIVPTDGNHDPSPNINYTHHFNTDNSFKDTYKKPQFDGTIYSFVYGDVLFIVYSMQDFWRDTHSFDTWTSVYLSDHVGPWFYEQVRKYPDTKYRVSLSHFNLFSGSVHSTDSEPPLFRKCMLPVFKDCEIDVALQGHDHTYEVIGPVDSETLTPIMSAVSDREEVEV
ncbi:MAG: metallophosphoesterase, partial [Oscillospiraceae bacterium]|nr:metallophosphoesterase [Oscillospiraceae bacterium]